MKTTQLFFIGLTIALIGFNVYFGMSNQNITNVNSIMSLQRVFASGGESQELCFDIYHSVDTYCDYICEPEDLNKYVYNYYTTDLCVDGDDYFACQDCYYTYIVDCDGDEYEDDYCDAAQYCN